ncbi:hypothetical protein [Ensifer soli]|uniref:hypothetical protein n=1 Tax=Ciceribacter sp. sgz301302 TaxID=3342379 RepID=UPI0035B773AE
MRTGGAIAALVLLSGCASTGGARTTATLSTVSTASASQSYIAALQGGVVSRLPGGMTLGNADRQRALEAEYRALEAAPGGQPVTWQSQSVSGSVVAAAPYQVGSQNCRQYSHTVTSAGQQSVARGAACRNPNGSWTPLT